MIGDLERTAEAEPDETIAAYDIDTGREVNLGILLSTFARTELQVIQFIPIVIVPQALLGGVFWSISSLPDPLQPIARVLPLTYAIDGLRNVLIRGEGLASQTLQVDLLVLLLVAVVLIVLGAATIRREVA